jgi:hypothetical protein
MPDEAPEKTPELSISPEKVCYIIAKAREFDAKDVVTDPDDASNATDDAMISVLEDHRDDPVVQEIAAAIFAMSQDEQVDLVTMAWLGRGDGSIEDWYELRAEATRAQQTHRVLPARHAAACRLSRRGAFRARPFLRRMTRVTEIERRDVRF